MKPRYNSLLKYVCNCTNGDKLFTVIEGSRDYTVRLSLGSDSNNDLQLKNNAVYSVWSEHPIDEKDTSVIALIKL